MYRPSSRSGSIYGPGAARSTNSPGSSTLGGGGPTQPNSSRALSPSSHNSVAGSVRAGSTGGSPGQKAPLPAPPWLQGSSADQEAEAKRKQKELEAERLWWSEASERQVKELESSFGEEFDKTAARLRADIHSSQDKLEMLVESERNQRHSDLAELRRDLDSQKVLLSDVARQLEAALRSRAAGLDAAVDETSRSGGGGGALAAEAQERVERERKQDLQLSGLEAAVAQLRHDLASSEERQRQSAAAQAPALGAELLASVEALQKDVDSLRERTSLQGKSQEEMRTLHQVITQSMGELTRGLEEVSNTAAASERKLRQKVDEVRSEVEAAARRQKAEVAEAVEQGGRQFAQSVADERERRTTESNVLRARLDAVCGQIEDIQMASEQTIASIRAPAVAPQPAEPLATTLEVDVIRAALEATRGQVSELERSVVDVSGSQAMQGVFAEAKRCAAAGVEEMGASLRDGLSSLEERLLRQLADGLAGERSWCAEQLAGIWRHADEMAQQSGQQSPGGSAAQGQAAAVGLEVPGLRADLVELKEAVRALQEEKRSAPAGGTTGGLEAQANVVPFLKSAGLALSTRVDLLQEQLRSRSSSDAARLDALDVRVQQAARVTEVRKLEEDLQRLEQQELRPLVRRLEAAEAESRRTARELRPLAARCDATESEIQRLARDCGPLAAEIRALNSEVLTLKVGELSAVGAATPGGRSQAEEESDVRPGLSGKIKANLGGLLQKVHQTLAFSQGQPHQDSVTAAGPLMDDGSALGLPMMPGVRESGGDPGGLSEEGVMQALRAVQELQARNLALREENEGLEEEIIAEQQNLSPHSVHGLQWTPSAQQSVCATPADTVSNTAQFVPPMAFASEEATPSTSAGMKSPDALMPGSTFPAPSLDAAATAIGPAVAPAPAALGQAAAGANAPQRSLAGSSGFGAGANAPQRSLAGSIGFGLAAAGKPQIGARGAGNADLGGAGVPGGPEAFAARPVASQPPVPDASGHVSPGRGALAARPVASQPPVPNAGGQSLAAAATTAAAARAGASPPPALAGGRASGLAGAASGAGAGLGGGGLLSRRPVASQQMQSRLSAGASSAGSPLSAAGGVGRTNPSLLRRA